MSNFWLPYELKFTVSAKRFNMKLVLIEPKYLKESISIISELVNEGRFKITPSAVELVAMDPANVAMVIFKLLSSCFSEYNVEKEIELGINLNNLLSRF